MRLLNRILIVPVILAACSASAAPKDKAFETKGEGYSFSYSYPNIVQKFPALFAEIEKNRNETLAETQEEGSAWIKDRPNDYGGMTIDRNITWQQVTNLPGYLSLTVDEYRFDGGAHGNFWRSSVIWNKAAAKKMTPADMFNNQAAFDKIVQTPFCDRLDIERSSKRDGEKVDRTQTEDWRQACPKPSELIVILGSSDGKAFNRMAIYAAPYAVGPYVEGAYEIDLPITSALLAAVKPAYRSAFAVTPKGRK